MFVKKTLLFFLFITSNIYSEIPITNIRGLASILKENYQHLSPLCGAMVWNSGYVKNLYNYGQDDNPLVQLTKKSFYLQPDGVTFGPTTLPTNITTYFDEELIGQIVNALETNEDIEKILNTFFNKEEIKSEISTTIEKYNQTLKTEQLKIEQKKIELFEILKTQISELQNNYDQIEDEKLKKRIIAFFQRVKKIDKTNIDSFFKLIKNSTEEIFITFKNKQIELKQLSSDSDSIKRKGKKISSLDLKKEISELTTLIKNANELNQEDNIFTVYDIFLALLWRKSNSKQDYQKYFNQLDNSFFINKEIIFQDDWLNNLDKYKKFDSNEIDKIKDYKNPGKLSLEDFIIYQKIVFSGGSLSLIQSTNVNYKKHNFLDCGETSIRNFLNILLYDPTTQSFNIEILKKLGLSDNSNLIKFYKKYPDTYKIESHDTKDPNNNAYDAWTAIVSAIPDVIYRNPYICNISGEGGIQNIYIILGHLLEIENFNFDTLKKKLTGQNIHLNFKFTKNNDLNIINISFKKKEHQINLSWKFDPTHFVIEYQKGIDEIKTSNIKQFQEKLTVYPDNLNIKELQRLYVIYGNYLTKICINDPTWNLSNINLNIKPIPLYLNTNLKETIPSIIRYYSPYISAFGSITFAFLKNKERVKKEEYLISKYLDKIIFLNELNFQIINEIIKQKIDKPFEKQLKKIINKIKNPKQFIWIIKSLIHNNYQILPNWIFGNALKELEELLLDNEQITKLPSNFGTEMENLNVLYLNNNNLISLPKHFGQQMPNLKTLNLENNNLEKLPVDFGKGMKNLEFLNLKSNKLKTLPENIGNFMPYLKEIYLLNNKIENIPKSLLNQNISIYIHNSTGKNEPLKIPFDKSNKENFLPKLLIGLNKQAIEGKDFIFVDPDYEKPKRKLTDPFIEWTNVLGSIGSEEDES